MRALRGGLRCGCGEGALGAQVTETLTSELALQIVQQGLIENWKFYAIFLGLLLLSSAARILLDKYLGKRAEVYATRSDLDEIVRQLKATTELTEQVKAAVSHADWLAREWKAIRRTKLEELVVSAISLTQWLDHQRSVSFFQLEQKNPAPPADRVDMLTSLYFPELRSESAALVHAQNAAHAWITSVASKSLLTSSMSEREAVLLGASPEWLPLHGAARSAVAQVKAKAASVMVEMRSD
jgi:hypothetical protein